MLCWRIKYDDDDSGGGIVSQILLPRTASYQAVTGTTTTLGSRNFAVAAAKVWNSLPVDRRLLSRSLPTFGHKLKHYFVCEWAHERIWGLLSSRYINFLIIIIIIGVYCDTVAWRRYKAGSCRHCSWYIRRPRVWVERRHMCHHQGQVTVNKTLWLVRGWWTDITTSQVHAYTVYFNVFYSACLNDPIVMVLLIMSLKYRAY